MLIVLGLALLLGIRSREALLGIGLVFTLLTVGLILIAQEQGVAWLGVQIVLVVARAGALALQPLEHHPRMSDSPPPTLAGWAGPKWTGAAFSRPSRRPARA